MPRFDLGHHIDLRDENGDMINSSGHVKHQSLTSEEEVELEYQALMQAGKEGKVGYAVAPSSKKIAEGLHMYVGTFVSLSVSVGFAKLLTLTLILSFSS